MPFERALIGRVHVPRRPVRRLRVSMPLKRALIGKLRAALDELKRLRISMPFEQVLIGKSSTKSVVAMPVFLCPSSGPDRKDTGKTVQDWGGYLLRHSSGR